MDKSDQNLYIFVLGRRPDISAAELKSLLKPSEQIALTGETAILHLSQPLENPQKTLDTLGGTIKISKIFDALETPAQNLTEDLTEKIVNRILKKCGSYDSKINYGISAHNLPFNHEKFLRNLLKNVKRGLSNAGKSSRFVNKDFKNVHNVVVAESNLINKGIEILATQSGAKIYLAETIAIQDFKSYELRDYGRPARDMESGMLPPKIAQIMINLAGLRKLNEPQSAAQITPANGSLAASQNRASSLTIYDPFCGSGTILTEALMTELNAIGSDKNEKAVFDAERNFKWLISKFHPQASFRVFKKDILDLSREDLPEKIDAIVSESYLGPRITRPQIPETTRRTIMELENLYVAALEKFKELRLACPIVLAIAAFKNKNSYAYMENFPATAKKLGFTLAPLSTSPRGSLIYDRPDQFVAREIFCLQSRNAV